MGESHATPLGGQVHSAVHATSVSVHIEHEFDDISEGRARCCATLRKRKQREKYSSGIKHHMP